MTLHPDYGLLLIQEIKIMRNLFLITHRIVRNINHCITQQEKINISLQENLNYTMIQLHLKYFFSQLNQKNISWHHLDLERNNYSKENLAYINYIFSIKEQKNILVTDDFNHLSSKQLSIVFSKIINSSNQEVLNFIDNYENKKKKLTSKLSYWKKSLAPNYRVISIKIISQIPQNITITFC